jgi:hypothetical protein
MDADNIERKIARLRALDEVKELVEERATALAEAEGLTVFNPWYGDNPNEDKIRNEYRARARKELGIAYSFGSSGPDDTPTT